MLKQAIITQLRDQHHQFLDTLRGMSESAFCAAPPDKWSAGQQLAHIVTAVAALIPAFQLPRFIVRLLFGKAPRPSRSYDQVVAQYLECIRQGGKASKKFTPAPTPYAQKEKLIRRLSQTVDKLCGYLETLPETALDTLRLPHPLLGKLTLREMLYFTIYHVQHHHQSIRSASK